MQTKRTILVADDVALFRDLEALFLTRSGRVLTASGGKEALELVRRERPDLVLADLYMPDLDGEALCHAIKSDPELRDTPVVVVLRDPNPRDRARALRAGADDLLSKPLVRVGLIETVNRFLRFQPVRGLPRVDVSAPVAMRDAEEHESWGTLRNVSRGGVFVETGLPLGRHSEVALRFTLPEVGIEIAPTAEVIWRRDKPDRGEPAGLGLRFLDLDREARERLVDYVYDRTLSRDVVHPGAPA
jgi:uncharacterized protein (TIGR02266 family)